MKKKQSKHMALFRSQHVIIKNELLVYKLSVRGIFYKPKTNKRKTSFENLDEQIWYNENFKAGKMFGYPICCINEFCKQSPQKMKDTQPTQNDIIRFKAAHINGGWTGFIPCTKHAKLILSEKIKLSDLIKGRDLKYPPFPQDYISIL